MLDRIEASCGAAPTILSGDSGYFSAGNVVACEQRGIDAYLAVGRQRAAKVRSVD